MSDLRTVVKVLQSIGGACSFALGLVFSRRVHRWNRAEIAYWRQDAQATRWLVDDTPSQLATADAFVTCCCVWNGDPLELQVGSRTRPFTRALASDRDVHMYRCSCWGCPQLHRGSSQRCTLCGRLSTATRRLERFSVTHRCVGLWTSLAMHGSTCCCFSRLQAAFRTFASLACVLFSVTPPVFAIIVNAKRIPCSSWRLMTIEQWSRWSARVAMVCLVVPVALAIIPQAAGVVGADDGDCWINLALDKDDTFAWQIAAFQGWLVLAWLVAFVAVGWMACNITPMTGGWRAKILAFSLPVVVLVRTPLLVCAGVGLSSRASSMALGCFGASGRGPHLGWARQATWLPRTTLLVRSWCVLACGNCDASSGWSPLPRWLQGTILPLCYSTYWHRQPRDPARRAQPLSPRLPQLSGDSSLAGAPDSWGKPFFPTQIPKSPTTTAGYGTMVEEGGDAK